MPTLSSIFTQSLDGIAGGGIQVYATIAELPLSGNNAGDQAYVSQNNRLYLWTGVGWFNIALINTNPTISQGPAASYVFATDGTPIVITLIASDPEGIPITWSYQVTSGALGNTAIISQNNNVFTITPSTNEADSGLFSVTFTASDGVNIATAVSLFELNIVSLVQWAYSTSDPYIMWTNPNTNTQRNFGVPLASASAGGHNFQYQPSAGGVWDSFGNVIVVNYPDGFIFNGQTYYYYAQSSSWTGGSFNFNIRWSNQSGIYIGQTTEQLAANNNPRWPTQTAL